MRRSGGQARCLDVRHIRSEADCIKFHWAATMRTRIIALMLSGLWPATGMAAEEEDGAQWVTVGPPARGMRVDLGTRQWVAYGPQALVRTRMKLAKPDTRGAVILQMEMLVNCQNETIAILDTEGLDARGERIFARTENGTPVAVGSDKSARDFMEVACSPPTIQFQSR